MIDHFSGPKSYVCATNKRVKYLQRHSQSQEKGIETCLRYERPLRFKIGTWGVMCFFAIKKEP